MSHLIKIKSICTDYHPPRVQIVITGIVISFDGLSVTRFEWIFGEADRLTFDHNMSTRLSNEQRRDLAIEIKEQCKRYLLSEYQNLVKQAIIDRIPEHA